MQAATQDCGAGAVDTVGHVYAEQVRYRERSTVERVNGRLKEEFGGQQPVRDASAMPRCCVIGDVRRLCALTVSGS